MKLTHTQIWAALDAVARQHGLTASGLARRAGLDPTAFNRSKRETPAGKARWPSTESLAKVLEATGTTLEAFAGHVGGPAARPARRVPLIGLAQAGSDGFFDDLGLPSGAGWDEVEFPGLADESAYALEVAGDSMLPVFRDGDIVLVSPTAAIRRNDRVVVKTRAGEVMVKQLHRRTARRVELVSLNPAFPNRTLEADEVEWIARIIWASQ